MNDIIFLKKMKKKDIISAQNLYIIYLQIKK